MTPQAKQSSRVPTAKPRSIGGILGGVLGIVAMSAIAGVLVTAAITPVVAVSGAAATSMINIFEQLPGNLNPGQLAQPTALYAKQGDKNVKFAEFFDQNREPVGWNDISQYAKDALVAIEDPRFFSHGGVDALAAGRAVVQNLAPSGDMSGASTITMQYVRNVIIQESMAVPDPEAQKAAYAEATRQTMDRKLKEMRLAISVEKQNTKDDILLGYMNIAPFGGQIYGIESAAQTYYGVAAKDLTLAQAASIVGITNQPNAYRLDDQENLAANTERRNLILGKMFEQGKITQEQYDEAIATPVEPKITPRVQGCAVAESNYGLGHFCDYVQRQLKNDSHFGEDAIERQFNVSRGGYDIITTIDLDMQKAAVEAMRANVAPTMEGIEVGAASVSTEVNTGRVLAMTQNRPYSNDESLKSQGYTSINYNTDFNDGGSSGFQVGSTFKPVTLANWIRTGHSVRDIVNASGRTIQENSIKASCFPGGVYGSGSWPLSNDNLGVQGPQSVLTVIGQSLNGGVISMQQRMDLCETFDMAEKMGMKRATKAENPEFENFGTYDLTMTPSNVYGGTDEMSPLTMALAYGSFSGGGKVCTAVAIDSITGPDGEAVAFDKATCKEAMAPEVAAGVAYALQYAVSNGLARHAQSAFGTPHLAKTGTTDDYWDNWTVGGSSRVTTATWVGNVEAYCWGEGNCSRVDTRNFGGYYGLTAADTRIWPAVMYVADEKYGGEGFGDPSASALKETRVQVPDVRGMSFDEAKKTLEAADFTVSDGGEVDSAEPNGSIARTDPEAGATVSAGAGITLYRSNGKAGKIPDGLTGAPGRDAEQRLKSAGFSSVDFTCSGGGSPDPKEHQVTSVSPESGSEARFNTKVTLTLKCED